MGKSKVEIQKRHNDILAELDKMEELASRENRVFTEDENRKYDALVREDNRLHIEIQGLLDENQLVKLQNFHS